MRNPVKLIPFDPATGALGEGPQRPRRVPGGAERPRRGRGDVRRPGQVILHCKLAMDYVFSRSLYIAIGIKMCR